MGDKNRTSLTSLVSFHNARSGVGFEEPERSGATAAVLAIAQVHCSRSPLRVMGLEGSQGKSRGSRAIEASAGAREAY